MLSAIDIQTAHLESQKVPNENQPFVYIQIWAHFEPFNSFSTICNKGSFS